MLQSVNPFGQWPFGGCKSGTEHYKAKKAKQLPSKLSNSAPNFLDHSSSVLPNK